MTSKPFNSLTSPRRFVPLAVVFGLLAVVPAFLCGEQSLRQTAPTAERVPLATGGRYSNLAKELLKGKNEPAAQPIPTQPAKPLSAPPSSSIIVSVPPSDQRPAVHITGDTMMRSGVVQRPLSSSTDRAPVSAQNPPSFAQSNVTKPNDAPCAAIVVKDSPRPEEPRVGLSIAMPSNASSVNRNEVHRSETSAPAALPANGRMIAWSDIDAPAASKPTPPLAFGTLANTTPQVAPPLVIPHQSAPAERLAAPKNPPVVSDPTVLAFEKIEPIPPGLVPAHPDVKPVVVQPPSVVPPREVAVVAPTPTPPAPVAEPKPVVSPPTVAPPREVAVVAPTPPAPVAEPKPVVRDVVFGRIEPPKPTPNGYIATAPLHQKHIETPPQVVLAPLVTQSVTPLVTPPPAPQVVVAEPVPAQQAPLRQTVSQPLAVSEPILAPAPPVMPAPRPSSPPLVAITTPRATPAPVPTPAPLVAVAEPQPKPVPAPAPQVTPTPRPTPTLPQVVVSEPKPAPREVAQVPRPTPMQPQVAMAESQPKPVATPAPQVAPTPRPVPTQPQVAIAESQPKPVAAPAPQEVTSSPRPTPTPIPGEPPRLVAQLPPQAAAPSQVRPAGPSPVLSTPPVLVPRREVAAAVPSPRQNTTTEKDRPHEVAQRFPQYIDSPAQELEAGFSHSSRYSQRTTTDDNEDAGISHSGAFR